MNTGETYRMSDLRDDVPLISRHNSCKNAGSEDSDGERDNWTLKNETNGEWIQKIINGNDGTGARV